MKIALILLFNFCVILPGIAQKSVYNYSVSSENGQQFELKEDSGKIVWIVMLPVMQRAEDSAFLSRIDSVSRANSDKMITIAVPSYDDGYSGRNDNRLMKWYQNTLNAGIIISQPGFTHKTAGQQQTPLFQWLTNASMNSVFDQDITGPGSSFFIDNNGKLYAEVSPAAKFSNKVFNMAIHSN